VINNGFINVKWTYLGFDVIPDNSSHFISIEITHWFGDLDLGGESS